MEVDIRYNLEAGNGPDFWKVIIDGVEHLAEDAIINVPTRTTRQITEGFSRFHISCHAKNIVWHGKVVVIQ